MITRRRRKPGWNPRSRRPGSLRRPRRLSRRHPLLRPMNKAGTASVSFFLLWSFWRRFVSSQCVCCAIGLRRKGIESGARKTASGLLRYGRRRHGLCSPCFPADRQFGKRGTERRPREARLCAHLCVPLLPARARGEARNITAPPLTCEVLAGAKSGFTDETCAST